MKPLHQALSVDAPAEIERPGSARHRLLGTLIRDARDLSDAQIEQIVAYQRERGMRFGEAAVALRLVERRDVLEALSRQFHYTTGYTGPETSRELAAATDPFGDQADAFRELRSRLLLEVLRDKHCAIAVVSPDAGDGKTYLAANLAVAFSQLGERTLLIDADIRTPRQHHLLRVDYAVGLSTVLAGFANLREAVHAVPGLPGLHLLPAGAVPPNPVELLQRPVFALVVREMLQDFQHVIVDTPAAARGPDARIVAARCGVSLVVARRGRSALAPLQGLLAALSRGPAEIAGVVLNEH